MQKVSQEFFPKRVDAKTTLILIVLTFVLITVFAESLTGKYYYTSPGKKGVSKYYIDKGDYTTGREDSQCKRIGGIGVSTGRETVFKDIPIKILEISDNIVLISVNNARRAMEFGYEKYVGGLFVTVTAAGEKDACLIVRDYY